MIIEVGTVTDYKIEYNRDRRVQTLMLRCRMSSDRDIQTVEYYGGFGDDSIPAIGTEVIIAQIGAAWKIALVSRVNIEPAAGDPGDRTIRSVNQDGSSEQASIVLKSDGNIEINPGSGTLTVNGNINLPTGGIITGNAVFNGANSNTFVHDKGTYRDAENRPLLSGTSGPPE
jgi:hypothetical protein